MGSNQKKGNTLRHFGSTTTNSNSLKSEIQINYFVSFFVSKLKHFAFIVVKDWRLTDSLTVTHPTEKRKNGSQATHN
jgi:hypothetical protein